MFVRLIACAASGLSLMAAAGQAGAVTFLTAGASASCAESTCFKNGTTYKITWTAAELAGRMGIQTLKLDRKILGDMQDYSFRVTFENAAGEKVGDWGSFMIAGLAGETVNLFGPGFVWDSSNGDLVLTLSLAVPGAGGVGGGGGGGGGGGHFGGWAAASGGPGAFGGAVSAAASEEGVGMLNDVAFPGMAGKPLPPPAADLVIVAPEPQSWGLMMLGFGMAGALLRRRRQEGLN